MTAKAPTQNALRKISMEVHLAVDKILPEGVKVDVHASFSPRSVRRLLLTIVEWPVAMSMINRNFVAYVKRCERDGREPHPEVYPQTSMEGQKFINALQTVVDPYLNEWIHGSIAFGVSAFNSEWRRIAKSLPKTERYRPRYPPRLETDNPMRVVTLQGNSPS